MLANLIEQMAVKHGAYCPFQMVGIFEPLSFMDGDTVKVQYGGEVSDLEDVIEQLSQDWKWAGCFYARIGA